MSESVIFLKAGDAAGEGNEIDKADVDPLDISDMDPSANDDSKEPEVKKKKPGRKRKRDVEMKKKSDDEDDSGSEEPARKMEKLGSPGPYSPGHREPRSCVLNQRQRRKPLSRLLEQLLRNLEKKDPNQFFAWPVTDNFAPGYSDIIRNPMDFSTIKQKIDDNEYRSLNCFISDFKLMCNNAMKYNKPGTVYHKAARKLIHNGLKQLTPAKLRPLGHMFTYMYEIPLRELGFDMGKMDVQKVLKQPTEKTDDGEDCEKEEADPAADTKVEVVSAEDEVKLQMEAEREEHRKRLARKAFPRMDSDGLTTLCILVDRNDTETPPSERPMTLGQLIGKLSHGTGSLQVFKEDRRNIVKGVKSLNYGPFSSYAPSHDSTFANLTKEESHTLYHTYGVETGLSSNEELLRFDPESPWNCIYDMEDMFPVTKPTTVDESAESDQIANAKVDIDQLKSLSELGIDVDFISEMEDDIIASQQDYGLTNHLKQTLTLLRQLESEQKERLSTMNPAHLSLIAAPGTKERDTARATALALRAMAARVAPKHIAPLPALRKAMGVTLHHLDTPIALEDWEEISSEMAPGSEGVIKPKTGVTVNGATKTEEEIVLEKAEE